jgi:4-hydroxyphenylpyruvate dioxygenase
MRTSIATVSISGSLDEKLYACAAAGFDGVEIFEADLVASDHSPEEIRCLARRLGLSLDLYQPLRDIEGVDDRTFAANLRRAEHTFTTAQRLGIRTVLVCSNVASATVDSDDVSACQLHELGELAQKFDIKVAFEALAWGRYVNDYRRSYRIVELADHPAVGVCLDSFHVLSRGHDPTAIENIPGHKIFALQLADAPALTMDVLSWSRHHRLFPGEGNFDLTTFVAHVLATGFDGPLSLEVFNDTFRQTDPVRTAVHARRSLVWLEDKVAAQPPSGMTRPHSVADAKPPNGFDFVEVKAENTNEVEVLLEQLGFTLRGHHRTKPVALWAAGEARVVLNEQHARDLQPRVTAIGLLVPDADATSRRASDLMAPPAYRRTYACEQVLAGAITPDGSQIFWVTAPPAGAPPPWVEEFENGMPMSTDSPVRSIDHVSLTQQWQTANEAALFLTSIFGLSPDPTAELAGPTGLVRSQLLRTVDDAVRLTLNVAPQVLDDSTMPHHVAFACNDVFEVARRARARGLPPSPVPDNYYDYLASHFSIDADMVAELRSLGLLYDRSPSGEFIHFYTRTVGSVFFEFVERRGHYEGHGAGNVPVRLAAQRRRPVEPHDDRATATAQASAK